MTTISEELKALEKAFNTIEKHKKQKHYKDIGYAPRCKVCNSPQVDEIERLREEGCPYEVIIERLDLDMSIMSLSRHFKHHYPKKTEYKLKRKKLMLENVIEVIKKYPYLEEYFNNKSFNEIEEFNEVKGFCIDCFKLCDLIPPNEVYDSNQVQISLSKDTMNDLDNIGGFSYLRDDKPDKKTIKLLLDKDRCLSCKNTMLTERLNMLERLISALLLGINDIEPNQLLYSLKVEYDNNIDLFYEDIMKKSKKKLMR